MEKSIKEKAFSGIVWSGIDRFAQQLVAMAVRMVLARMILPDQFGLVGLLMSLMLVANLLQDSGFFTAMVRRKDPSASDFSTIFYFNVGISTLLYAIFFFGAPLIADFWSQPMLTPLTRVLFLALPLNALGMIQQVRLVRAMDFRRSALVTLAAAIVSGGVAIAMVFSGAGVWSLVAQQLVMPAARTLLLWLTSDFRPSGGFDGGVIRELLPFSSRLLLGALLAQAGSLVYTALIGKRYQMTLTGYYTEAYKYHGIAADALSTTLSGLTLPLFSQVRDQRERLRNVFRRMIRVAALVAFPAMLMVVAVAEPAIGLLLGEQWLPAAPILQLLSLGGMILPVWGINSALLTSEGHAQTLLLLGVITTTGTIAIAWFTLPYGVRTMVVAASAFNWVNFAICATLARRALGTPFLSQLKDIAPYLLLAAGCILPTMLLQQAVESRWLQLVLQIAIGGGAYFGVCRLLGSKVLKDTQDLVFKKLKLG